MSAYRTGEGPRFICIVCYETTSTIAGTCARCGGAPMQPIEGEILDALRRRAKTKREQIVNRKFRFIGGGALLLAIVVDGLLLGLGAYDVKPHAARFGGSSDAAILFGVFLALFCAFALALGFVASRMSRYAALPFDAAKADTGELLAYLGIELKA